MRLCHVLLIGLLSGCTATAGSGMETTETLPLDWMVGCWQTDNDSVEETWVMSRRADQLFGYSVTSKDGRRVFFEMMRIDIDGSHLTFSAYPRGQGPTRFNSTSIDIAAIEFVNDQNDYPQRIRYSLAGVELIAVISKMDGSKTSQWRYRRCA